MNISSKRIMLFLITSLVTFLGPALPLLQAQDPAPDLSDSDSSVIQDRPFRLPFDGVSGPSTWAVAQPYGNTTGAYFQRFTTYGASGGIHFGIDIGAPCGTDVVAIADGIVFAVDGPFGSPPHNLMIDHPELGYASMYGHLLQPPDLRPGQVVKRGQVVALSGTSGGDCDRGQHLHLEIRDLNHVRKFNPTLLIDADWNNLTLYGSGPRSFMRNLDAPRQWQSLYDQPEASTGGPILNDFANTWPMDWSIQENRSRANTATIPTLEIEPVSGIVSPAQDNLPPGVRQITTGICCTNPYWNTGSTEVRFIDQPATTEPVGVWGLDVTQADLLPRLVTERLGIYSPDHDLVAYPDRNRGLTIIERLADGQQWELDTQENRPAFTLDNRQVLWTTSDSEADWRPRTREIWLANTDGSQARILATLERGGPVAWLPDKALLISSRLRGTQDTLLSKLSLEDGSLTELITIPRSRDVAFSPNRRYMIYLVNFEADRTRDGVWLLDLEASELEPKPLPFFGSYRWRDDQHLVYIPFDPEASGHTFYEYDILSGQSRQIFPREGDTFSLTITNNDWSISPDGRKIALVAAKGSQLDGIWVIDIN